MKKLSNLIYFCITFLFFTYSDLFFTNLIAHKLLNGWRFSNRIISIAYAENTGAAFSIMQHSTKILIALSILAIFGIFYFIIRNSETILKKELFFLSFLMAGILGNLYERTFLGHVRDFFDLTFINFPIFNISDILINIGVLGIIILILISKRQIKL